MEKLDKERYLKRVIIVCWIALGICFGIKLFGGNLFEIMCNNENFIKVCDYADDNFWAKFLIAFSNSLFSVYFLLLAMCEKWKFKKRELITAIITICLVTFIKILNQNIGLILDIWQVVIMPMIFSGRGKRRCVFVILGNILLVAFQMISMIAKNIGLGFITDNGILISFIFNIDVTLMILLYYLYINILADKKGEAR